MRVTLREYTILFLLIASLLWACAIQGSGENISASRTVKRKLDIKVMGIRRYYMLHVPAGYSPDKKIPLVIVLHGAFSTPGKIERESGFSVIADRERFLVAYPSGAFGIFGFLKHNPHVLEMF